MRTIQRIEDKYLLPAAELVEAVFTASEGAESGKLVRRLVEESAASGFMSPGWS